MGEAGGGQGGSGGGRYVGELANIEEFLKSLKWRVWGWRERIVFGGCEGGGGFIFGAAGREDWYVVFLKFLLV